MVSANELTEVTRLLMIYNASSVLLHLHVNCGIQSRAKQRPFQKCKLKAQQTFGISLYLLVYTCTLTTSKEY